MRAKPIETIYNGYKFRSRLEARWAVFFDAAGIAYDYELQGYKLDDMSYLPDFYLPDFDVHAEVKPNDHKLFEESRKLGRFIDFNSSPMSKGLILLGEIPYYNVNATFPVHDMLCWHKGVALQEVRFKGYRNGYPTKLIIVNRDCAISTARIPEIATVKPHFSVEDLHMKDKGLERRAYLLARQARFEFDETPVARKLW